MFLLEHSFAHASFLFFLVLALFFASRRPRIFQRRMQALMCALPLVVSAEASSTIWRDEQARIGELPGSLRCSLHLLHTNDAARPGGKKPNSFSAYEDAILLLQHVRDGVPLPSVQLPPPRKPRAAKDRYRCRYRVGKNTQAPTTLLFSKSHWE